MINRIVLLVSVGAWFATGCSHTKFVSQKVKHQGYHQTQPAPADPEQIQVLEEKIPDGLTSADLHPQVRPNAPLICNVIAVYDLLS